VKAALARALAAVLLALTGFAPFFVAAQELQGVLAGLAAYEAQTAISACSKARAARAS